MNGLTTALLSRACHTFLTFAYPGGERTIPEKRRAYLHIPADADIASYLPPADAARGICQAIKGDDGTFRGYAFRLGSVGFPHLKLQVTDYKDGTASVFAVDTHDAFPRTGNVPQSEHPDFEAWTALQKANRLLKEQIEGAWEEEGLWTFNRLLRQDLDEPAPFPRLGDKAM